MNMNKIFDLNQLNDTLKNNSFVLAYFSGENCGVCSTLKPKLEELVKSRFKSIELVEIPTELAPELTGHFRMFTIPAVILFVEGKDYIREVRNISLFSLSEKISKIVSLYNE